MGNLLVSQQGPEAVHSSEGHRRFPIPAKGPGDTRAPPCRDTHWRVYSPCSIVLKEGRGIGIC